MFNNSLLEWNLFHIFFANEKVITEHLQLFETLILNILYIHYNSAKTDEGK